MKKFFIFFITLVFTPINLFSALQDFNVNEKYPKKIITLTLATKSTKTILEKAKENKVRTAAGGFTAMVGLLGAAETIRILRDNTTPNEDKIKIALGSAIFLSLSHWILTPIFSEENNDTPEEQNNNQH